MPLFKQVIGNEVSELVSAVPMSLIVRWPFFFRNPFSLEVSLSYPIILFLSIDFPPKLAGLYCFISNQFPQGLLKPHDFTLPKVYSRPLVDFKLLLQVGEEPDRFSRDFDELSIFIFIHLLCKKLHTLLNELFLVFLGVHLDGSQLQGLLLLADLGGDFFKKLERVLGLVQGDLVENFLQVLVEVVAGIGVLHLL